MQSSIEVDEEGLYTAKVKWKGQRTVGKGNEGMDRYNFQKNNTTGQYH